MEMFSQQIKISYLNAFFAKNIRCNEKQKYSFNYLQSLQLRRLKISCYFTIVHSRYS